MLPRKHTINKKKEIETLFQKGRSSFGGPCGVKVIKNNSEITRFAIVVPAKVAKKAVARNTIKRRLSEIARKELPFLQEGWDVFVLALPPAQGQTYRQLQQSLTHHLRRLHIYR